MRSSAIALLLAAAVSAQDPWNEAARNGADAREALTRCRAFVHGWLRAGTDPLTGLIPSNLDRGRDIWDPHNAGADNYAFMVLSAALTDRDLYRTRMLHMLETETALTSRVGSLPDTWRFSTRDFANAEIDMGRVIFASSEYVKDGLMPIHELLGETPWSTRMLAIVEDIWEHAPVETPGGRIPSTSPEVNGEMMQVTARIFWLTGETAELDRACRIADHYLLEPGHHPTRDADSLRLRDHGCELISGLTEVYFACHHHRPEKAAAYREPLHAILDRILEVGVNEHGMMWNVIDPKTGEVPRRSISDTWGYNYNGFYTVYLVDGVERYREATLHALRNLAPHYRNFAWEGTSADGYADSIEGAINLYAREVEACDAADVPDWIDSEIRVMFGKQQENGVVEGWHGDGNFARTALMYALWKQQGCRAEPWREDLSVGAIRDGGTLRIVVAADAPWEGHVRFDAPRHRTIMHMPIDYPRINQFPEWFTVDAESAYRIRVDGGDRTLKGAVLLEGLPVDLKAGGAIRITVGSEG